MRGASLLLALESHLRHNSSASPASRRGSRAPCLVRVPVSHLSYLQAVLIGLLEGVSELFPVSSLGHSIIIPALIGGNWAPNLDMTADKSPYLSFVVAVHVATAMALIVFYRRDWARIISGLLSSIRNRSISTSAERLAWLLIAATIPVGVVAWPSNTSSGPRSGAPGSQRCSSPSTACCSTPWRSCATAAPQVRTAK